MALRTILEPALVLPNFFNLRCRVYKRKRREELCAIVIINKMQVFPTIFESSNVEWRP